MEAIPILLGPLGIERERAIAFHAHLQGGKDKDVYRENLREDVLIANLVRRGYLPED